MDNPTNRAKKHLPDKAEGPTFKGLAERITDRNRGSRKGGQMKHSAKVMAFGVALTTAMVPQALAQTHHPANAGPPPIMSPAQQQTQTQQKMQAPKQQNTDISG